MYKEQMKKFLVEIVFPEFASPHGHLRYGIWNILLKKPMYKEQMEKFLVEIVFWVWIRIQYLKWILIRIRFRTRIQGFDD
jgi:hypothetical protein